VTGVPDGVRLEEAVTRSPAWSPGGADAAPASRPDRPAAIELAAAILIVSALIRLFVVALAIAAPPEAGVEVSPTRVTVETAIQVATMLTGFVVRSGRAWLVVVNIVVVLAFLQIISVQGPVSLAIAVLYAGASAVVFAQRPWFAAMGGWRAALRAGRRA
jgi:hypothetical protein